MKMKKKIIGIGLVVSVIAIGVIIMGAASHTDNYYHGRVNTFFSVVKAGKVEEAADFILSDNPWVQKMPRKVQGMKTELTKLNKMMGSYQSHEKLLEKVVANRYAYLYYFVCYDRQPLRFCFTFYKPKDEWMILNLEFNPDIDEKIAEYVKYEVFEEGK